MSDTSEISAVLGFLSHLSIDELKDVLNDDSKFEELTKDSCNKTKESGNSNKEMVLASNKSLGEYITSQTDRLPALRIELADLYDGLKDYEDRANFKLSQVGNKTNSIDANTMLVMLQSATTQLEEETDLVSEKFLDRDISLETFLDQHFSKRKLLHTRKLKLEKITAINNHRNSYRLRPAPNVPSVPNFNIPNNMYPISSFPSSIQPMQVPYPLGPSRMPMPGSFMPNHF